MVLAIEALPLPANMYGHVIDAYKFVKRRSGTRVETRERPADAVRDIKKDRRLVCDMIADSYGVMASEVHQTVAATVIPNEFAKALGAEAGSSALEVIRRYLDTHGRLFEISESTHPAGRYVVTSVRKRVGNPGTTEGRAARDLPARREREAKAAGRIWR